MVGGLGLALMVSGCGKGIGGGPAVTLNPIASNSTGTLINFKSLVNLPEYFNPGARVRALGDAVILASGFGSAAPDSLSYAIYSIRLCDTITTSGTAYDTSGSTCSTIYNQPMSQSDYDSNTVVAPYLDMVDMTTTKTTINQNAAVTPGTYRYGLVDWFKPVKVKGSVPMTTTGGSGTIRTRVTRTEIDTASTAEETTVVLNNGGAWTRFQDPFVYDGSEPVTIDLVFNPDDVLKASSACSNCDISAGSNGAGIFVPILGLTPVPHKASETAQKEVYTITGGGFTNNNKVRMEVYYVKEDATKTIKGVSLTSVIVEGSTSMANDPPLVFSISQSGTTITLKDYQGGEIISFDRLTTEGATGTASVNCANTAGGMGTACGGVNTRVTNAVLTLFKIVDVK